MIFSGCTKQNSYSPSMSAYVNDTAFSAIGPHVVTVFGGFTTITATNLLVGGTSINTIISIIVRDSVSSYEFTQPLGNGNVSIEFKSPSTKNVMVLANSGIVNITKVGNHLIQGTFSCSIADTLGRINITNGSFTGTN